jgi:ferric-dicitrate binding protein FerR (iron transport regulator)
MPKAQEYIAFAEQCEKLAKRFPEHADAFREMAATWRLLAEKARAENGSNEH